MRLTENRDPAFWQAIADHPGVARHVHLNDQHVDFRPIIALPTVLPLASDHGGYLFHQLDGLGRIHELHALFMPQGWGHEAAEALKAAMVVMYERGAGVLIAHEIAGHPRSQPPRSHGWRPSGGFSASPIGHARTWTLPMNDWMQSPAFRRMSACPH